MHRLDSRISRRAMLRGSALAAAGAGALAIGCSGGDDDPEPTATAAPPTLAPQAPVPRATLPPARGAWKRLDGGGVTPSPRRDMSLTYDSQKNLAYMFGGRAGGKSMNDLWTLDPTTGVWTEVQAAGDRPAPRFGHSAVSVATQPWIVVTMGQGATDQFFDDIWSFDTSAGAWRQLGAATKDRPPPRYGAGHAIDPLTARVFISHGFTDKGRFDDSWIFAMPGDQWTALDIVGDTPIKRCLTRCAWTGKSAQLLLFAGQTENEPYMGDLWALDVRTGNWRARQPDPLPGRRNLHAGATDAAGARWYIYGGDTPDGPNDELWACTLALETFEKVQTTGDAPSARYSADIAVAGTRLVMFGGTDGNTELGDTWALDLG